MIVWNKSRSYVLRNRYNRSAMGRTCPTLGPAAGPGRPRTVNVRLVLNAIPLQESHGLSVAYAAARVPTQELKKRGASSLGKQMLPKKPDRNYIASDVYQDGRLEPSDCHAGWLCPSIIGDGFTTV